VSWEVCEEQKIKRTAYRLLHSYSVPLGEKRVVTKHCRNCDKMRQFMMGLSTTNKIQHAFSVTQRPENNVGLGSGSAPTILDSVVWRAAQGARDFCQNCHKFDRKILHLVRPTDVSYRNYWVSIISCDRKGLFTRVQGWLTLHQRRAVVAKIAAGHQA